MLAVRLEKGRVTVIKARRPQRPCGFALIRLLSAGICSTDLELQRGYYGFSGTPGHEFAGEVVEADNTRLLGRRVVGEINLSCRRCEWCKRGLGRHCPNRSVLGIVKYPGAFREFLTLPEANLHILPESISDEEAVFIEPLAAACELLDQSSIPKGSDVAVLGDGKLGLLAAQAFCARGLRVHLFGRHPEKLRIAEDAGIEIELTKNKLPVAAYDWIVEATGTTDGLRHAIQMARPRGSVFMKSTVHGAVRIDIAPVIVNEITLIGSRCGRFEPAIDLMRTRKINVRSMISDRLPLSEASRAFRIAAKRGVLKVLLNAAD
jgi:threonine dehydrogenase-like Zn-dependent dehydrogenase